MKKFDGFFKIIRNNMRVMKDATKDSAKGFKEMKDEVKGMDFKKMPKKGFVFMGIATVVFILFLIGAFYITRL